MTTTLCPIYTIGDGTRTQMALRDDGVWFMRTKWRGLWQRWEPQVRRPYAIGAYIDRKAGNAVLP